MKSKKDKSEVEKSLVTMDPFYENNFEVIFPIHDEVLTAMVKNISPGVITFNILINENKEVIPLYELLELAKISTTTAIELIVNSLRKDGAIVLTTSYQYCKFEVLTYPLNYHDYESNNIKDIQVIFTYNNSTTYNSSGVKLY